MVVSNIDFQKEFYEYKFDDILLNNNNPLINSHEYYTKYKQDYLNSTKSNLKEYNQLTTEYNKLISKQYQNPHPNEFIYAYIDNETIRTLQEKVKDIVIKQKVLFKHFLHYVQKLNEDVYNIQESAPVKRTSRNFLSKLLDSDKRSERKRSRNSSTKRTATK